MTNTTSTPPNDSIIIPDGNTVTVDFGAEAHNDSGEIILLDLSNGTLPERLEVYAKALREREKSGGKIHLKVLEVSRDKFLKDLLSEFGIKIKGWSKPNS